MVYVPIEFLRVVFNSKYKSWAQTNSSDIEMDLRPYVKGGHIISQSGIVYAE